MSVQPKNTTFLPFMTMATNMNYVVKFTDAFPVVALPGVGHMPAAGGGRERSGAVVLCGGD